MNTHTYSVIMAGGIGSRFWPMSRTTNPKQFLDILGTGKTLIQQTYERMRRFTPEGQVFVVTNEQYRDLVKEQLPEMGDDQILLEPARRNTAPCVAYAAYKIHGLDPEANIVVAPSDHLILKEDEFVRVIELALDTAANNDALLTLGIRPSRPDTGYGYIQYNEDQILDSNEVCKVKTFTEKPDLDLAKKFLESGDFLWNSGIFIWSSKSIISSFNEHLSEVGLLFEEGVDALNTPDEQAFIGRIYPTCKNISIDYGIMEKAKNVYTVPAEFGWSDLGTWGSLYTHVDRDGEGNAVVGAKQVMLYDSKRNMVSTSGDKLVVIQGLEDFIVVNTDNALLICKKEDEQMIKQFVAEAKIEKGDKYV
ncbi:mannose-1-phosphate guanylyltransferase [Cryomorphaceae bacterium]|nr:mannose-1-phosphate guanylyltransferase [Cryomorphaceae bacterium]